MFAVVDIAGQQFKVEKDQILLVNHLDQKEGSTVDFDRVLLVDQDGKVQVGTPTVKGVKVSAKVIGHESGEKVTVFKKKRRKGYKVKNGFRASLTRIQIKSIQ